MAQASLAEPERLLVNACCGNAGPCQGVVPLGWPWKNEAHGGEGTSNLGISNEAFPIKLSTPHYLSGERQSRHICPWLGICGVHLKIRGEASGGHGSTEEGLSVCPNRGRSAAASTSTR